MTSNISAGEQGYEAESAPSEGSLPVTAALTIVGFACYWACNFVLLFSGSFAPLTPDPMDGFLMRFVMLLGLAVLHPFSGTAYSSLFLRPHFRAVVQVASCVLVAALVAFSALPELTGSLAVPVQYIAWFLIGACSGQMLVIWGLVWSDIDADRADNSFCMTCIAGALLLAAAICTFTLFAPASICASVALAIWIASTVLQAICLRRLPTASSADRHPSPGDFRLMRREMVPPLAASIALGLILAHNGLHLGVANAFPAALAGIAAGACVQVCLTRLLKRSPRSSSVERASFPLLGLCLIALPFLQPGHLFALVVCTATACATVFLSTHWDTLVILTYRKHLQPAFHFEQGLIATTAGVAVGWGLVAIPLAMIGGAYPEYSAQGWGTSGLPASIGGAFALDITTVSCLTGVLACLLAPSICPATEETEFKRMVSCGIPQYSEDTQPTWESTCGQLGERFGLTPRERECFVFLARGRNAEHIAKELVISLHTAKTHTSRIYRKIGINSQQQLIDLVETNFREGRGK